MSRAATIDGAVTRLTPGEAAVLGTLDRMLRRSGVRMHLDGTVRRLKRTLAAEPSAQMSWEILPLSLFRSAPPGGIRSAWVFLLRGGVSTGAELHPNSHQRTRSYRGSGVLRTQPAGGWESRALHSAARGSVLKRWASIPLHVPHEWVVGNTHWAVVSFHTALADELIEERPDEDGSGGAQRLYVGESAR